MYEKKDTLNDAPSKEPSLIIQQLYLISISRKRTGTTDSTLKLHVPVKAFLSPSSVRNREFKPGRRRRQRKLTSPVNVTSRFCNRSSIIPSRLD